MTEIAVIIPFFQHQAELLGIAVASIMAQSIGDTRFTIMVVDDGSPVSAEDALNNVPVHDPHRIIVLRQANGGPGAARNCGIEEVLKLGSEFVAFIDSDDAWLPDHVARGLAALRQEGSDYYFSDILNDGVPEFPKLRYMKANLRPEEFEVPVLKTLDGPAAVEAIAVECLPHMTTIICKAAVLKDVRFDERFRCACEDQLFFMDLARVSPRVTFSTALGGERGEGVSIYRETMSWGSAGAPFRLLDELAYRQHALFAKDLNLRTKYRLFSSGHLRIKHFVFLFVRNLRRNPRLSFSSMMDLIKRVPVFIVCLPIAFAVLPIYHRSLKMEARVVVEIQTALVS